MIASEVSEELRRAWAEIDKLRTFVRSLEWSGLTVVYCDGSAADSCPSCGGIKPGEVTFDDFEYTFGHEDDCALELMATGKSEQAGRSDDHATVAGTSP